MSKLVLVTGVTGYVGSHVARLLLSRGYKVRGTLRSLKKCDEVTRAVVPAGVDPANLTFAEIDLLDPVDRWVDVVKGCDYVQHVASPFPIAEPKHEDDLIKPAVEGTLAVLRAAASSRGSVKRVVITSSVAAVAYGRYGEWSPHGCPPAQRKHVFDEKDWSDVKGCDAYPKSKTLAEKAAWEFVEKLDDSEKFELAVINPGFIQVRKGEDPVMPWDPDAHPLFLFFFFPSFKKKKKK
jgi:nucleoside-diphosphate-sugar epimerase